MKVNMHEAKSQLSKLGELAWQIATVSAKPRDRRSCCLREDYYRSLRGGRSPTWQSSFCL